MEMMNNNEECRDKERLEFFPLFISSEGKKALVIGGGKIAARRIGTLLRFAFEITVVAPEVLPEIEESQNGGQLTLLRREFEDSDLDGAFLVVAATDRREVNRDIGALAAQLGIFASVADAREECSFLFPAIAANDTIVAGLTSGGKNPRAVSEIAQRIREIL